MLERILEKQICAETAIVGALIGSEKPGRELREIVNHELTKQRFGKMSGPAFYQFLSQMEERGVVISEVRPTILEGENLQLRWFKYTGGGTKLKKPETSSSEGLDFGGLRGPEFAKCI